jgi:hypothetical protein
VDWERQTGKMVKIGLTGTKDVIDAILEDPTRRPRISTVCLSYWWYRGDGKLYAPEGGKEIPGRYTGNLPAETTPESLHRQIREYRLRYPDKAIIQHHRVELEKAWAFLMGGGSMVIAGMQYPDSPPPKEPWEPPDTYIAPEESAIILPTYDFINSHLSKSLQRMRPADIVQTDGGNAWALADNGNSYLVFCRQGRHISLDLSKAPKMPFEAKWFDPRTGILSPAGAGTVVGAKQVSLETPDERCWVLWLYR